MTTYRITLPAGLRLLNANGRQHHHDKRRITARLRAAAHQAATDDPTLMAALAAAKPGPLCTRAHITGIVHPATRRRIDPANLYPSFKACVDGLVDAGILDDDDSTRVIGPDMRLGPVVTGAQLVLLVRPLTTAEWTAMTEAVSAA